MSDEPESIHYTGTESGPIRVAFVSPTYPAVGQPMHLDQRWPVTLATTLAADEGCTMDFISYGMAASDIELAPQVTLRLLPPYGDEGEPAPDPLDVLSWGLPHVLDPVDVVHVQQPLTRSGETAILTAKALGKPVFVTDFGGRTSSLGASLGLLDLADAVICYSKFAFSTLPPARNVEIVPGGVDATFFAPGKPTDHRAHLLHVGSIRPGQGIEDLISALPAHVPLKVCGPSDDVEFVQMLAGMAGAKDVEFVTGADDVRLRHLYQHAWATVTPPPSVERSDQSALLSLTALESMACATPVVAYDGGSLPEFVENGVTGLIVSSGDMLSDALGSICTDRGSTVLMGLTGRERVESHFSLNVVAHQVRRIYDSALSGRGKRPV